MARPALLLALLLALALFLNACEGKAIKIVEQKGSSSSVGGRGGGGNVNAGNKPLKQLKASVPPALPSGPLPYLALHGRCFDYSHGQYLYQLCPFDNVTQHDVSTSWNAYAGVLGIFNSWQIHHNNDTFASMFFDSGDSCGHLKRESRVTFQCGQTEALLSAAEPSTCKYAFTFSTPIACNTSLSVRDSLHARNASEAVAELDALEEQLYDEELSEQGYAKRRDALYARTGILPPPPPPAHAPSTTAAPATAASPAAATIAAGGAGEAKTCEALLAAEKRRADDMTEQYNALNSIVMLFQTELQMKGVNVGKLLKDKLPEFKRTTTTAAPEATPGPVQEVMIRHKAFRDEERREAEAEAEAAKAAAATAVPANVTIAAVSANATAAGNSTASAVALNATETAPAAEKASVQLSDVGKEEESKGNSNNRGKDTVEAPAVEAEAAVRVERDVAVDVPAVAPAAVVEEILDDNGVAQEKAVEVPAVASEPRQTEPKVADTGARVKKAAPSKKRSSASAERKSRKR